MNPQLIAAIFGALSGALVNGVIQFLQWLFKKKSLKKAIKMGLYFEIDRHQIIEVSKDPDGQPNFALASFQDLFYTNNISDIVRYLPEDLLQLLAFYYSGLKSASDCVFRRIPATDSD